MKVPTWVQRWIPKDPEDEWPTEHFAYLDGNRIILCRFSCDEWEVENTFRRSEGGIVTFLDYVGGRLPHFRIVGKPFFMVYSVWMSRGLRELIGPERMARHNDLLNLADSREHTGEILDEWMRRLRVAFGRRHGVPAFPMQGNLDNVLRGGG